MLLVDGKCEPLVVEARERTDRGDEHRQTLAPAQALTLEIAVDNHQRVKADRAVVDEDAFVHLGHIDTTILAAGDQLRRLVELGRNAEVAGEMVERAQRQDAKPGLGADQR